MSKIKFPIVIEEPGSLYLYNSKEDAEQDLEHYDVDDNVYRGWDASGRLLAISSDNKQVNISLGEDEPTHKDELKRVLRKHLKEVGKNINGLESKDLDFLLHQAEFFLFKPQNIWEIIQLFFSDFIRTIFSKSLNRG